ncbi:MAG: hypothetical protein V4649_12330 [Bacteroidota bacterium]
MRGQEIPALREVVGGDTNNGGTAVSAWGDLFVLLALREVVGGDANNGGKNTINAGTNLRLPSYWQKRVMLLSRVVSSWKYHTIPSASAR